MIVADAERWKRLSPLLDGLLDLPADARAERLATMRLYDPLLAAELASLIADAARAEAAQFLSGRAELPAEGPGSGAPGLAGTRIGAYVLETLLGEGGTGAVWRARRADGRFDGHVAVKLLHLSLVGRTGALRFEREGAILARLSHPHIARMLDAGVTAGGQPYLVLELVEGERIDRHCDAKRLRVDERVAVFRDVLDAVAHAHRHLVIHRDIKPGNVMVGADGSVKLLDFGIAKLLQDHDGAGADLTGGRGGVLTPDYAAPEQLRGESITTATDVYALGVLLYQLLSGQHPTAPPGATPADLMRATLDTDPGPLSDAAMPSHATSPLVAERVASERDTSVPRLRRELGGDLETIVAKALKKAPAERYPTVDAFADDLRRWAAHEPVSARPDSLAYRTTRFVRRHRGAVAAGALTAAAIVVGVAGTAWQAHRAEIAARQAGEERDRALQQLTYSEASDEFMAFLLQEGGGKPMTMAQLLARGEEAVDRQFADDPALRTRMLLTLADLYGQDKDEGRANALLKRAQAAASGVADAALQSQLDCVLAEQLGDENQHERAMVLFARAIARTQGAAAPDRAVLAVCLHDRAQVESLRGDAAAAFADAEASLAAYGTPRPGQRMGFLLARAALAEANGQLGREALAVDGYQQVVDEMTRLGRGHNAIELALLGDLARHLSRAGQWRRADVAYRRGMALATELDDTGNADPMLQSNYAVNLVELGDLAGARSNADRALEGARTKGHSRSVGAAALAAAIAACAGSDAERCRTLLRTAREALQARLAAGNMRFATIELQEARLALAERHADAAADHFRRADAILAKAQDTNPGRLRAASGLARAQWLAGDLPAARAQAERAVAAARDRLGGFESSLFLGEALLVLGEVASAQDDRGAARTALAEAVRQLGDAVGHQAPLEIEATRALAALGPS